MARHGDVRKLIIDVAGHDAGDVTSNEKVRAHPVVRKLIDAFIKGEIHEGTGRQLGKELISLFSETLSENLTGPERAIFFLQGALRVK